MPRDETVSPPDPRLDEVVRILAASVNTKIAALLLSKRRDEPQAGWLFLSQIAQGVGEKPGTVGLAIQKLLPLLEEKREKGKRYFRSRLLDLRIVMKHA